MLPCQGRCREFEPRLPLHIKITPEGVFFCEETKARTREKEFGGLRAEGETVKV